MIGCTVSELNSRMSQKELLFHLSDLEAEPTLFDLLNNLFAVLNKNILNCSMADAKHKQKVKATDFMLKLKTNKEENKNVFEIARANKYKGLVL